MPEEPEANKAQDDFRCQGAPGDGADVWQLPVKGEAEKAEVHPSDHQGCEGPESPVSLPVEEGFQILIKQAYRSAAPVFPDEQNHTQRPADEGDNEKVMQELIQGVEKVGRHASPSLGHAASADATRIQV
jgi:hypothetical protein